MGNLELLILALGLAMDAFAVAVGLGLTMPKAGYAKAAVVGLYFGFFQGIMPVIGFFAATFFAEYVTEFSHWISFALLAFLGWKMIWGSFEKSKCETCNENATCNRDVCEEPEAALTPRTMLPLALATSVDAMAVGVSLAFLQVNITWAALVIGAVTFAISAAGVRIGNIFGAKFKNKAAFAGGVILVLIGLNILRGGLMGG
ncbi:MAG: manganese efflux pump MntP family protein [Defluviitaleaceae bacterium]|nr:manganese efflux pump MntP family protein [Defluviitaleaceae bacterium]MCL2224925.1 manganese efflux pump MntP family protein [Defluviitaleaceae bacterium]MCL2262513.1 manganese efflux pump MntP family protein [Defluviitaleaceae bacterium]